MSEDELAFGAVLVTKGRYKGKLGYYDNDEYVGDDKDGKEKYKAVVYLEGPFQNDFVLINFNYLRNIRSLEHQKFKKENPDFVKRFGIKWYEKFFKKNLTGNNLWETILNRSSRTQLEVLKTGNQEAGNLPNFPKTKP